ncbi:MAG: hypothetical protein ABL963_08020 [Longimicrobiales bacterium]
MALDAFGFLERPDGALAQVLNPGVLKWDEIDRSSCVVLVGEPGTGKSHEMRSRFHRSEVDAAIVLRDLRSYDTAQSVFQDVFGGREVQEWIESEGTLTLVLDSLDEALLEIRVLGTWLCEQLRRLPASRLRLRIACRTAQWPLFIETELGEIWNDVSVYEIAPLSRADVSTAATSMGLDAEAFLTEVMRRDAGPLATKPTTLRFLLDAFKKDEAFPSTQVELYDLGCELLCREADERRISGRAGDLEPRERLAVAARLGAITILGNRSAIWRDGGAPSPAEVSLGEVAGGFEPTLGGGTVEVRESAIHETLGTGLFSARGPEGLGWTHQTYGEFLAAKWVVRRELSMPQLESLVRHPDDPDGRFIPQLREVIAWLVSMHAGVRDLVLSVEPELMLESDLPTATAELRAAVVDALLAASDRGTLRRPDWTRWRHYERLKHAGLAKQLRPYLSPRGQKVSTRELVLDIAVAAGVVELQHESAAMALNAAEPLGLRADAARLIAKVGDASTRILLRELAIKPQDDDVEDDLKGASLEAVWPDHVTPKELFAALTSPKKPNRIGDYDSFLARLPERLPREALAPGLQWSAETQLSRFGARSRVRDALLLRSWDHLDSPEVCEAMAAIAVNRLAEFEGLIEHDVDGELQAMVAASPRQRRALLSAIVDRAGPDANLVRYVRGDPCDALVLKDDVDWLLERAIALPAEDQRGEAWAMVLRWTVQFGDSLTFAKLYAHRDEPHIRKQFADWWSPILIDSPGAEDLRQHHRRMREFEQERDARRSQRDLPSAERVLGLVDGIQPPEKSLDGVEHSPWVEAAYEFMRREDGRFQYGAIVEGPTWKLLSTSEQERVLTAAEEYVRTRGSSVSTWALEGKQTWGAWAGDRALRLLQACQPERVTALPKDTVRAWGPVILRNRPAHSESDAFATHLALLARIHEVDAGTVLEALRMALRDEDEKYGGHLMSLEVAARLWDDELMQVMVMAVRDDPWSPAAFRSLLGFLLERESHDARLLAESAFSPRLPRRGPARDRAVAAAAALLASTPDGAWSVVKAPMRRSPAFRREVALAVSQDPLDLRRFPEHDLGEMFAWLTEVFPYPDPDHDGVYSPSAEDQARSLRGNVLAALVNRASPKAALVLEQLAKRFQSLDWLPQTVIRAREAHRRESWSPPMPQQLLALAESAERRLVETRAHLAELLIESLDRFESELHGELPAISGLWDDRGAGRYRPKGEQDLSDAIARHFRRDLRDRGIVAGREVVIRRGGKGGVPGQRTDVYVSAIRATPPGSPISAIVEIKGSWHEELMTALKGQLVDDYLAKNPECGLGLYVVGWYLCNRWHDEPRKRETLQYGTRETLRERLLAQAEEHSSSALTVRSVVLDISWP